MDTHVAVIPAPEQQREGSTIRRFLAERGVIVMKETHTVATLATMHRSPLDIGGQVLVLVRGTDRQVSVGVKFEHPETATQIASTAFVDSDELEVFIGAFKFITTTAIQMAHEERDYTEITYATRDDVRIGFFQDRRKQQAFVRLGTAAPHVFFRVEALHNIRAAVAQAGDYVEARRKAWESR